MKKRTRKQTAGGKMTIRTILTEFTATAFRLTTINSESGVKCSSEDKTPTTPGLVKITYEDAQRSVQSMTNEEYIRNLGTLEFETISDGEFKVVQV